MEAYLPHLRTLGGQYGWNIMSEGTCGRKWSQGGRREPVHLGMYNSC